MLRHRIRNFLALCAAAAVINPSSAQVVELKLSHYLSSVNVISVDFISAWASEVEKRSNGKVKITIYPAGSAFGQIVQSA